MKFVVIACLVCWGVGRGRVCRRTRGSDKSKRECGCVWFGGDGARQ